MEPSSAADLADLLAAERYLEALAATEAALERLGRPTNGEHDADGRGRLRRTFDLRFVAVRAAYALGRKAAELERLSHTDALTGLPNRRAFDARLDEELARARRHGHPLVLALVDLDRFKEVNDRFGHPVGDAVLRRAAEVVREALRASDVAARWGGEEFALLLPDTPHEEAYRVLERVRAALAAASWGDLGADLALTASIGAAASAETDDVHELLRRADHRLFAAKRAGRDRTLVADPT